MKVPLSILGNNSTKEKIIEILSEEWPLSAKKIYNKLTKNYRLSLTYQATHKALKELNENNILEKRKEGYLPNKEWVKKLGEMGNKMIDELKKPNKKNEGEIYHKIKFNNHSEFIKWTFEFMKERIDKDGRLDMIFYFRHVPAPNSVSNDDLKNLNPYLSKIKWTIFSGGTTPLDKWSAKYWQKLGIKVKLGQDIPTNDRMIIMNDYVINVFSSKEDLLAWDKAYSGEINKINLHDTIKGILNSKYKTTITIIKDKELANFLRR